jgi:hypothetical protein
MLVKHLNFVESVKFLIERNEQLPSAETEPDPPKIVIPFEEKRAHLKRPLAVHEILSGLIAKGVHEDSNTAQKKTLPIAPTSYDIAELERIVLDLSKLLDRLKTSYHQK